MTPASAYSAVLWGVFLGVLNGLLSRYFLAKSIDKSDKIFYSVFFAGIFYRLAFLAGAVWLMRDKKYIILVPFAVSLIVVQFIFEVIPVGRNGHKTTP